MTILDEINSLFLTDGLMSWIGLIFVIMLLLVLVSIKKEYSVVSLPVAVFVGLLYLNEGLGWHFAIMLISVIFMLMSLTFKKDK